MNTARIASGTADSQASENGISRRSTLTLAAASHGLTWTRAAEINAQLIPFLT
jgi:hypothetical protein